MSNIKKLTVKVKYEVDITDIEVTPETYAALKEVHKEGNLIGSGVNETPAVKIAQNFLVRNVQESYARSHYFVITELE